MIRSLSRGTPLLRRTGRPRALVLTDKGREALGLPVYRPVPLLDFPFRDEERDRRRKRSITVNVSPPPDTDAIRAAGYVAGVRDERSRRR